MPAPQIHTSRHAYLKNNIPSLRLFKHYFAFITSAVSSPRKEKVGIMPLMQASHCPEIDTRWIYEYDFFLYFARRWPRNRSTTNQQPKHVRLLQKVTRWHPIHTRFLPKVTRWHPFHKRSHINDANFDKVVTRSTRESHPMGTRRRIVSTTRSNVVTKASRTLRVV